MRGDFLQAASCPAAPAPSPIPAEAEAATSTTLKDPVVLPDAFNDQRGFMRPLAEQQS